MSDDRTQPNKSRQAAPATHLNRVAVIGCGNVGMASAFALAQSTFVREIVLIDRDIEKARGEAIDLQQAVAVPMTSPILVTAGDYSDAAQCSIVVVTAGAPSGGPDVSRLDLLGTNTTIIREIVGKLRAKGFTGILIMTSNPVDILTQIALEESGLPACKVIGTGTLIDTARLRSFIANKLGVEPRAVDAYIIGEHGDSEVAVWSGARVAGVPLLSYPGADALGSLDAMLAEVRQAAPEIVKRKGSTEYAIAMCVVRVCEAILRNERAALAVSTLLTGQYGIDGVCLGTPCIVGANGVEQIVELKLDPEEIAALRASAQTLLEAR